MYYACCLLLPGKPSPLLCLHIVGARHVLTHQLLSSKKESSLAGWLPHPNTPTPRTPYSKKLLPQQTPNPGIAKPKHRSMQRAPPKLFHLPLDSECPQEQAKSSHNTAEMTALDICLVTSSRPPSWVRMPMVCVPKLTIQGDKLNL